MKTSQKRGLRGPTQSQGGLRDIRGGTFDTAGKKVVPNKNQQTPPERAQPGADMRGPPLQTADEGLPEGLKRERKGPLDKDIGRSEDVPAHVPQAKPSTGA